VFWLFFKIDLRSTTSMESSRRDLLNDLAEHRFILKNYQNAYYFRFSFTPKTGIAFLKMSVLFLLWLKAILDRVSPSAPSRLIRSTCRTPLSCFSRQYTSN